MARVFRSARGTVRSYSLGLAVFGAALGKKYPATLQLCRSCYGVAPTEPQYIWG